MLIAEDLLLLLTEDVSGRLAVSSEPADLGLAGAALLELTLMNKVDLSREGDPGKPGRVVVRDPAPTGDAVLDTALDVLAAHPGKKPAAVLRPLAKHLRATLYERLAGAGLVRAEEGRVLGVFPTHRWPARDAEHEAQVRRLVTEALVLGATPDQRSAALIALLHALGCEHKVVDPKEYDVPRRQLRERAGEIAQGSWASEAVRTAIHEMTVAVVVATSAAVLPGGSAPS
jgi:hypothetical protein